MSNKYIADADKKVLRQLNEVTNSAMGEKHINYESRLKTYPAKWLTDKDNGRVMERGKHFRIEWGEQKMTVPDEQQWQEMSPDEKDNYFELIAVPINQDKQPERMFTLDEMIAAMFEGEVIGEEISVIKRMKMRKKYFKQKFNIDL